MELLLTFGMLWLVKLFLTGVRVSDSDGALGSEGEIL